VPEDDEIYIELGNKINTIRNNNDNQPTSFVNQLQKLYVATENTSHAKLSREILNFIDTSIDDQDYQKKG